MEGIQDGDGDNVSRLKNTLQYYYLLRTDTGGPRSSFFFWGGGAGGVLAKGPKLGCPQN